MLDIVRWILWLIYPHAECDMLSVELSVVWIDDPKSLAKLFLLLGISCHINSFRLKLAAERDNIHRWCRGGRLGWLTITGEVRPVRARLSPVSFLSSLHLNWNNFMEKQKTYRYAAQIDNAINFCTNLLILRKICKISREDKHKLLHWGNAEKDGASWAVAPSEKHSIFYRFLILFHLSGPLFYSLCFTCICYLCAWVFSGPYITPTPASAARLHITHACTFLHLFCKHVHHSFMRIVRFQLGKKWQRRENPTQQTEQSKKHQSASSPETQVIAHIVNYMFCVSDSKRLHESFSSCCIDSGL